MARRASGAQRRRVERRPGGDGAMPDMTSGGLTGTNGALAGRWQGHPARLGYVLGAALVGGAMLVNVSSRLHERPGLSAWYPLTWEATSLAAVVAMMWLVDAAVRRAMTLPRLGPAAMGMHLAAATAFSAGHCVLMWSLRRVVYTLAGEPYGWSVSPGQVLYEYRKDLLTYCVLAVLFWVSRQLAARAPAERAPGRAEERAAELPELAASPWPGGPATFDIRDGARLLRVPVSDIVAAGSAGNYVAIRLGDGREKLMRGTLAQTGAALAEHGFVRVHRGWVVNPASVREMQPTSAGDYRLVLCSGAEIPMSRRYSGALPVLRGMR
jgi:hypothetical protein